MSIKATVDKIYQKVYDDHHITPEEFQMHFERRKAEYDESCKDLTEEEKEKIKRPCELLNLIFSAEDRDKIETAAAELEKEFDAIDKEEWFLAKKLRTAIEYHRAKSLAEKYNERPAYTTKAIRASYRKPLNEYKKRRY